MFSMWKCWISIVVVKVYFESYILIYGNFNQLDKKGMEKSKYSIYLSNQN